MRRKRQRSTKHRPLRYRKYKGCFGGKGFNDYSLVPYVIAFPRNLSIKDDKIAKRFLNAINNSLENPTAKVDFLFLFRVEISCGIILRAYADEFHMRYKHPIDVIRPKDKKSVSVLKYLKILTPDDSYKNYPDLECWNILDFDNLDEKNRNISISKQLKTEFIPACWKNHPFADHESQIVASAVAEIYFNCAEHAYVGYDNNQFQKWYIGAGEYPDSNLFAFCIFDRGQGFKKSMQQNVKVWGIIKNRKDSFYLSKAALGRSGIDDADAKGRGKGISSSIKQIKSVNGDIVIMSGMGEYSSVGDSQSRDRKVYLKGSLISFFVPIEHRKKKLERGNKNGK